MKTLKRAGIAAAVLAGIGILAGVWVLTKDVVIPRNDKGNLDFGKIEARGQEKDQLFSFLGRDVQQLDITVREVSYGPVSEAGKASEAEAEEPPAAAAGEASPASGAPGAEPAGSATPAAPDVKERKLGLARVDGDWTLTAPVHALADQGAADGLANSVAELRIKAPIPDVDPLDPKYGLNDPCVVVNIARAGGRSTKLLIGRDTTVGSDVYLMIEGRKTLYYASSSVKTSLIKEPKDLRDKKVAHFERDDVKVLVLDASGHRVVCEQTGKKDAREWWLTQPTEARADNFAVDDVLDAVKNLEAKDFVDDVKSLSAYGLDKPTVVARLDFGKDTDDVVVKLGRHVQKAVDDPTSPGTTSGPKDLVYCMTEGRDEVFLVDSEVEGKLNKEPIDLRDTTVVDFETTKANKVTIDRKTGQDIELVKADAKWSLQKPEFANADFSKVDNLLWDLKDIKAAEFLDDKPVNPSVSGLNSPEVTITVSLEGQDAPVEIRLGYKDVSGRYYCQVSSLDTLVLVGDDVMDKIPLDAEALKEQKTGPEATPPPPAGAPPAVKESE